MRRSLAAVAILTLAAPALVAHPGHGGAAVGALHPLSGIDHLLAMVAVGILAVRTGGMALWQVPATFLAAMALGLGIGLSGVSLPGVELAVAASVLALGAMIASARPLPAWSACLLIALVALPHGCAHAEAADGAAAIPFLLGMVATTALLHAGGIGFGVLATSPTQHRMRWTGGLVSACGLALVVQALA
jgi:urease accessory protein